MLATALAHRARDDIRLARNLLDATHAELAADSGLHHTLEQVLIDGPEAFVDGSAFHQWSFAGSEIRIAVTDELARIDINAAPGELLADLFVAAGVSGAKSQELAGAIVAYRGQGAPGSSPGAAAPPSAETGFSTIEELINVPGMTRPVFDRVSGAITIFTGRRTPQTMNASPLVLAALKGDVPSETEDAVAIPSGGRAGVAHVEARSPGGSVFTREAVVLVQNRSVGASYDFWLWQRGRRQLF